MNKRQTNVWGWRASLERFPFDPPSPCVGVGPIAVCGVLPSTCSSFLTARDLSITISLTPLVEGGHTIWNLPEELHGHTTIPDAVLASAPRSFMTIARSLKTYTLRTHALGCRSTTHYSYSFPLYGHGFASSPSGSSEGITGPLSYNQATGSTVYTTYEQISIEQITLSQRLSLISEDSINPTWSFFFFSLSRATKLNST